ncbi:MAG: hypothetical protein EOS36_30615 [Mesorhizobium sp.]|uniref:hypothetical protein n=1 Tax=Mesorhizobium sp. TaxID=1871066 RepID=UPI000FE52E44|nr:hypothetical protein [Mesorhizobium sp.]RWD50176.1 MAG: hypothetical protein EOS36_30615 [Mesorhizobium sp.]
MVSARYSELENRIKELKRLLLPSKFDPTGSYKDPLRVTTRALSFRVLAHAEVETYLEDRALEIATTALKSWKDSKFVSVVTFHLLGFGGVETSRPPQTLAAPDAQKAKDWPSKVAIDDRLTRCVSGFYYRVSKENHGIKEQNIVDMLIPLGFDMSLCDPLFMQNMSNFGEARGAVAHTSGMAHIKKAIDPKDEYSTLHGILQGLRPIDGEFDRLLRAALPPTAG